MICFCGVREDSVALVVLCSRSIVAVDSNSVRAVRYEDSDEGDGVHPGFHVVLARYRDCPALYKELK